MSSSPGSRQNYPALDSFIGFSEQPVNRFFVRSAPKTPFFGTAGLLAIHIEDFFIFLSCIGHQYTLGTFNLRQTASDPVRLL
jgi:hypothetical protein